MNNNYQKWLAGDGCCNAHNFIHIEKPDCKKQDVCDCEHILLEVSNLHTDDLVLQEQIDDLSGEVETKLDASAYTPTDLSGYATEIWVEDHHYITGVDLSDYATEQWVLDKHYISGVDLSDYATKEWVNDKGYLTTVEPLKTINGISIIGEGNINVSGASIDAYTKAESDARYQPKGNYLTEHQPIKTINNQSLVGTGNITISGDTDLTNYYTKQEVNELIPEVPSLSGYATEQWVLNKHYITSADTVFNNYATTANTYTKTEVNNLLTNKIWCGTQSQYDALTTKENDVLYLIHE